MTDTEKVTLCRKILQDFWGMYDGEGAGAMKAVLNCIGNVLDFKEEPTNAV